MTHVSGSAQRRAGDSIRVEDFEDVLESMRLGLKQVTESVAKLDSIRHSHIDKMKEEGASANEVSDEILARIDRLYAQMDTDRDQKLSRKEAKDFFQQFGRHASSIFSDVDENGDGELSLAEWRYFWQQLAKNGYSEASMSKELADFERGRDSSRLDSPMTQFSSASNGRCRASMRRVIRLKMLRMHDAWSTNGDDDDDDEGAKECFSAMFRGSQRAKGSIFGNPVSMVRPSLGSMAALRSDEEQPKNVVVDEYQGELNSHMCVTLHPHSMLRLSWDAICTVLVLYDIIFLPVFIFISDQIVSTDFDMSVTLFTACFWTADILISCMTGYETGSHIERAPAAALANYLRTWFILDLAIVIIEWVSFISRQQLAGSALRTGRSLRLLRISRILRLLRLVKVWKFLNRADQGISSLRVQTVMGVLRLSFVLFLLVHLLACGWFAVGDTDPAGGWVVGGLYNEDAYYQDEDTLTKYIASFRWTLAQVNGRTDREKRNMQEMLYTSLCAIFAIMFMSYFVGSMTTKLMELQSLLSKERNCLHVLQTYAAVHELSWSTVHMCKRYIKEHLRVSQEIDAEKQLLALLPPQTVIDLLNEVRMAPVCAHQLFCFMAGTDDYSLNAAMRDILARAACSETTHSMETVFTKGTVGDRMFFTESGLLMYSRSHSLMTFMTSQFLEREQQKGSFNVSRLKDMCWFLSRKQDGTDMMRDAENTQLEDIGPGTYLCEATLWTKSWTAKGDLVSVRNSKLVSLRCDKFIEVIKMHGEHVLTCCSFYAKCYNAHLRTLIEQDTESSDLIEVNLKQLLFAEAPSDDKEAEDVKAQEDNDKDEEELMGVLPSGELPFEPQGKKCESRNSIGKVPHGELEKRLSL